MRQHAVFKLFDFLRTPKSRDQALPFPVRRRGRWSWNYLTVVSLLAACSMVMQAFLPSRRVEKLRVSSILMKKLKDRSLSSEIQTSHFGWARGLLILLLSLLLKMGVSFDG